MATMTEIQNKVNAAFQSQRYEKPLDLIRSFVAKANTAGEVQIPLTTEGPFIQESINIAFTKNSTSTPSGGTAQKRCFTKLKFESQAAGNAQSSDYIPVQLIATPGAEGSPRYGARPFYYCYPKGDALIIKYDNRAPAPINGETNVSADERIEVCISGKVYPIEV